MQRRYVGLGLLLIFAAMVAVVAQRGDAARPEGGAPAVVSLSGMLAQNVAVPVGSGEPGEHTIDLDTTGYSRLYVGYRFAANGCCSEPGLHFRPFAPDGTIDYAPLGADNTTHTSGSNRDAVAYRGIYMPLRGLDRIQVAILNFNTAPQNVTAYYVLSRG